MVEVRDYWGVWKPLGYWLRVLEGRGKGTEVVTLDVPLPLWRVFLPLWRYKANYSGYHTPGTVCNDNCNNSHIWHQGLLQLQRTVTRDDSGNHHFTAITNTAKDVDHHNVDRELEHDRNDPDLDDNHDKCDDGPRGHATTTATMGHTTTTTTMGHMSMIAVMAMMGTVAGQRVLGGKGKGSKILPGVYPCQSLVEVTACICGSPVESESRNSDTAVQCGYRGCETLWLTGSYKFCEGQTLQHVTSLKFTAHLGRPFSLLMFAVQKLLCMDPGMSTSLLTKAQKYVVLSQCLALNINMTQYLASDSPLHQMQSLHEQVSNHMRICVAVGEGVETFTAALGANCQPGFDAVYPFLFGGKDLVCTYRVTAQNCTYISIGSFAQLGKLAATLAAAHIGSKTSAAVSAADLSSYSQKLTPAAFIGSFPWQPLFAWQPCHRVSVLQLSNAHSLHITPAIFKPVEENTLAIWAALAMSQWSSLYSEKANQDIVHAQLPGCGSSEGHWLPWVEEFQNIIPKYSDTDAFGRLGYGSSAPFPNISISTIYPSYNLSIHLSTEKLTSLLHSQAVRGNYQLMSIHGVGIVWASEQAAFIFARPINLQTKFGAHSISPADLCLTRYNLSSLQLSRLEVIRVLLLTSPSVVSLLLLDLCYGALLEVVNPDLPLACQVGEEEHLERTGVASLLFVQFWLWNGALYVDVKHFWPASFQDHHRCYTSFN
ncbi:hypothetical protein EI94DRAFT_1706458 [Lactarius quietus]|nr:hypothetical protein EI94DRAFT_1706458 [Lactarius quietus]